MRENTHSEIDLSKIKPGDEVTVRAVVSDAQHTENWGLHFKHLNGAYDGACRHFVHPDCIVSHTPKALSVGDKVKAAEWPPSITLEVLCIHDGMAWLRDSGGSYVQSALSNLERV
jgi:hypothetical protein